MPLFPSVPPANACSPASRRSGREATKRGAPCRRSGRAPRGERLARPRPRPGPRPRRAGAAAGSRSRGEAHAQAASACGPGLGGLGRLPSRLKRVEARPSVCQPAPPTVTARAAERRARACVSLLPPPRSPRGARPGARAGSSRRGARGVGVHPGSGRFFFPKGEAVDLKRHFKGSSILI